MYSKLSNNVMARFGGAAMRMNQ